MASIEFVIDFTGKTTIKDGLNSLPSYFVNRLIHGAETDLLEDTESMKTP